MEVHTTVLPTVPIAISADGYMARSTNDCMSWTDLDDKKLVRAMLKYAPVIIIPENTAKTMGRTVDRNADNVILVSSKPGNTVEDVIAKSPKVLSLPSASGCFIFAGPSLLSKMLDKCSFDFSVNIYMNSATLGGGISLPPQLASKLRDLEPGMTTYFYCARNGQQYTNTGEQYD